MIFFIHSFIHSSFSLFFIYVKFRWNSFKWKKKLILISFRINFTKILFQTNFWWFLCRRSIKPRGRMDITGSHTGLYDSYSWGLMLYFNTSDDSILGCTIRTKENMFKNTTEEIYHSGNFFFLCFVLGWLFYLALFYFCLYLLFCMFCMFFLFLVFFSFFLFGSKVTFFFVQHWGNF